jgi:hypothetical protein
MEIESVEKSCLNIVLEFMEWEIEGRAKQDENIRGYSGIIKDEVEPILIVELADDLLDGLLAVSDLLPLHAT